MMVDLNACECGAVPVRSSTGWDEPWYYTECVKCGRYTEAPDREKADERWNRKAKG